MSETITYDPTAGTHIIAACAQAAGLALKTLKDVTFNFNGIVMTATPGDTTETLAQRWRVADEKRRAEYLASDEYKEKQRQDTEDLRAHQNWTNRCILRLPEIRDLAGLVQWCAEFSEAADYSGVTWDKEGVAALLKRFGCSRNIHVGRKPEEFRTSRMMGEYIVGQAIECVEEMKMPPHPITQRFLSDYAELLMAGK